MYSACEVTSVILDTLTVFRIRNISARNSKGYTHIFRFAIMARLVWTLSDIGISGESKMVAITGCTYGITHYISV